MSENHEGDFLILSSPPTLLKTASVELALICWRHEFHKIYNWSDPSLSVHTPEFNINDVLEVLLPRHIPQMVNHYIKLVASYLVTWIDFHKFRIFNFERSWIILKCFDCVVFQPYGRICYRSTARNLLASDRLNLEEKYRIACVYCYKEDIDRLWPLVMDKADTSLCSDNIVYENPSEARRFAAVKYWNGVQRKEYGIGPSLLECYDTYALANIEFFCNLPGMPMQERITSSLVAAFFPLNKFHRHDVVRFLLPALNVTHRKRLLTKMPVGRIFISELAVTEVESCDCSLQLWKHVNDLVTNDQFFILLRDISEETFKLSRTPRHVAVILREIWTTAPKHLRDYVSNDNFAWFFDNLSVPDDMRNYGYDMGFYINLLDTLTPDLRSALWLENWRKFICLATLPDLYKLMKLCLVNENAIVSFKTHYMADFSTLQKEFMSFIKAGLYEELSNYLKFSCSDEIHVREVHKQILRSLQSVLFSSQTPKVIFSRNRCVKLNEFIDRSYFYTFLADEYKKQILKYNFVCLRPLLVRGYYLDEFRNLTTCLASRYNINEMKQAAYMICQEILIDNHFVNFDVQQWRRFLKWCAPSEEFSQLKKRYPWMDF